MNRVKATARNPTIWIIFVKRTLSLKARKSVLLFGVHYRSLQIAVKE